MFTFLENIAKCYGYEFSMDAINIFFVVWSFYRLIVQSAF